MQEELDALRLAIQEEEFQYRTNKDYARLALTEDRFKASVEALFNKFENTVVLVVDNVEFGPFTMAQLVTMKNVIEDVMFIRKERG